MERGTRDIKFYAEILNIARNTDNIQPQEYKGNN